MAPTIQTQFDRSAMPLADYFFIAGIESSQIFDEKLQPNVNGLATPPVEDTIEEHSVLDTNLNGRPKSSEGLNGAVEPAQRRQRLSYEARKSISSLLGGSNSGTASNRSSATIRGVQLNDTKVVQVGGSGLSDADFDDALRKFASERESFLEEIHFSAGVVPQLTKPKARKTQKIVNEDVGVVRSGVGSIRRRISTMNSLKRQPSIMRQCKWSHRDLISACLLTLYSFRPHLETTKWVQLSHTQPAAVSHGAKHASPQASIRTRSPGQISSKEHGRRA
jgi:hypothetical protein